MNHHVGDPARPNVVLCGASYGRAYVHALALPPTKAFRVIAVVGRGGARSRSLAADLGVPALESPRSIIADIGVAIVAVGGSEGDALSIELLHAGVPVLREHPVTLAFVDRATRVAAANATPWLVNAHFALLTAPHSLLGRCAQLRATGPASALTVTANLRTAYSAIDLLMRLAEVNRLSLAALPQVTRLGARVLLRWPHGQCNITLDVGIRTSAADDGRDVVDGHRAMVTYSQATLHMPSSAGPLLEMHAPPTHRFTEALWQPIGTSVAPSLQSFFVDDRARANRAALDSLANPAGFVPRRFAQERLRTRRTARIWESVVQAARAPHRS